MDSFFDFSGQRIRFQSKNSISPLLGFLWEKKNRINSLGLISLNNLSECGAIVMVSSCLVPGPRMRNILSVGYTSQIDELSPLIG